MSAKKISRRQFLVGALVMGSAGLCSFWWYPLRKFLGLTEAKKLRPEHFATIALLVNEIFPRTASAPSGEEVGVLTYMRRALSGEMPGWTSPKLSVASRKCVPISPGYQHLSLHYVRAAERLEMISVELFRRALKEVSPAQRSQVVARFSRGAKADVGYHVKGVGEAQNASDSSLFELIRRHAIEGYFSDPVYGGNQNYKSWESIRHVCHYNYPKDQSNCKQVGM